MIIYDLSCDQEHRFEGWFRNPDDFESQLSQQTLVCPICDSHRVRRIPSAVAIGGHHRDVAPAAPQAGKGNGASSEGRAGVMPAQQAVAVYQQLVGALMSLSEDVGSRFAEEARRIHYQEAPARPIHGETTDDEYDSLEDEGIPVVRLPRLRKEDLS